MLKEAMNYNYTGPSYEELGADEMMDMDGEAAAIITPITMTTITTQPQPITIITKSPITLLPPYTYL